MKGSPRRDALTAKFLLPPYALGSSASTVGPRKPSRRRCAGNRVLFTRGAEEPPRPEPGCLVGEGEQHEILGAFSSPRGAGQIKAFCRNVWGQVRGRGDQGTRLRVLRKQWPFVLPPQWTRL